VSSFPNRAAIEALSRKRRNPFYWLLVAAGVAFSVTACAYSVMAVRQLHAADATTLGLDAHLANSEAGSGNGISSGGRLMEFLRSHGDRLLIGELAVLGLATCAAIGSDSYWSGRD
jgi:hypothetical protein